MELEIGMGLLMLRDGGKVSILQSVLRMPTASFHYIHLLVHDVDVHIMPLPNNLCASHIKVISKSSIAPRPLNEF
jgi:hypothetical protein